MIQLKRRRVRLPIDTSKFDGPQDTLNNSSAKTWNGSPAQFEVGLKYGADFITDLSNLVELTLQIKSAAINGGVPEENAVVKATKTVDTFDAALTAETWADASKQHATFVFTGAELKLGAGAYWMIIVATITGESEPITLAAGALAIVGDGYENGVGEAPDPLESYLNSAQSDARYGRPGTTVPAYRSDIVALTGGAANALDSIATLTKAAGYLVTFDLPAGGLKNYILRAGTTAEASPGIIRPDDYNASTNAKYWELR